MKHPSLRTRNELGMYPEKLRVRGVVWAKHN